MQKKFKNVAKYTIFLLFIVIFAFFTILTNKNNNFCCAKDVTSSAKAMVVLERNSGRILYSKNENEQLPMASLTKIITAFYVVTHCKNLDEIVKIEENCVGVEGTSIGLKQGEHLSIRELLYGLMLRSGNDSAVALATAVCGSERQFVEDVNEWLNKLGFVDTRLENPHGLHHENHYTTAYELAKITGLALENSDFKDIVKTKEMVISNELKSKTSRNLKNKNKFLNQFKYADGVKTGFTKKAGRCFVGSATKNDMQTICVLLNCVPMFEECLDLTQKAFNEFSMKKIISKECVLKTVNVQDALEDGINVSLNKDFYYPLRKDEMKGIKVRVIEKEGLKAPINVGDEIGKVEITFKNQLIFSDKIYSINYIKNNMVKFKFDRIIEKML